MLEIIYIIFVTWNSDHFAYIMHTYKDTYYKKKLFYYKIVLLLLYDKELKL